MLCNAAPRWVTEEALLYRQRGTLVCGRRFLGGAPLARPEHGCTNAAESHPNLHR